MRNLKVLFWITIFLNSFLLFLIEPMFGRMIIPVAGSSVSSWNVALMCFQIILLGGYMYTHYLPKRIGFQAYIKVHIALLIASAVLSYALFRMRSLVVNTNSPALDVILILFSTIGLPFFVVSTSSTNFQRWYSIHLDENPYHLYSLSNLGNLMALIGYGLAVEVLFGLRSQMLLWNILYSIAVSIGVFIGITMYRSLSASDFARIDAQIQLTKKEPISGRRKAYWTILSFIPCSLMIATNSVLDNIVNVNHIPYFWLLPLIIYLVAYVIAFSRLKLNVHFFEKAALWSVLISSFILFTKLNMYVYMICMISLFLVSLVCNLYIVKSTPPESNLTEFYLYVSIGGALGGIFASLIAPVIFNNVYEFLILSLLFILITYAHHKQDQSPTLAIEPWENVMMFLFGFGIVVINGLSALSVIILLLLLLFYLLRRLFIYPERRLINIAFVAIVVFSSSFWMLRSNQLQLRNFYGVKTVAEAPHTDKNGESYQLLNLINGNTLHGSQFKKGSKHEYESLAYYDKQGSTVGRFFTANSSAINHIGVVGLGVGSLSGVSSEHQVWKYFEIDPQVIEIAENTSYFTMLEKYDHEVILGDARITLQAEQNASYDILVLDAYSGDLIPTSLLTKEAVELYVSKIRHNGILMFHISNRLYDLKPVLSKIGEKLNFKTYLDKNETEGTLAAVGSEWIMMTNNLDLVDDSWTELPSYPDFDIWTDEKHSIATILRKN